MGTRIVVASCILVLGLLATDPVSAQPAYGEKLPRIVPAEWLASNLHMRDMRIIDVRNSLADYWQEHIPGAVYLHPEALGWPEHGVPGNVMPLKAFADLLGKMGITQHTYVLVYGDTADPRAAHLVWLLDYVGHKYSGILDGGWEAWQRQERPVTQDYPELKPTTYRLSVFRLNRRVRAEVNDVTYAIRFDNALILDVRPAEVFTGEEVPGRRAGHIKGARNHFWQSDLNPDGTWKPAQEIKKMYEELGITGDRRVIVYCSRGFMAAHAYLALRYIVGYSKIRVYDGGFNEWAGRDDLPTSIILIR
jgi:thiosulfate/3-mercaptopyruvate sulfurtransferase